MNFAILRYFNVSGSDPDIETGEDHNPETHLIPSIIETGFGLRSELKIFGNDYDTPDGTCIRDYVHVTDLIEGHIRAFEYIGEKDILVNLGNGKGFSVLEVIKAAESVLKKKIHFLISSRRAGDPAVLISDTKKAQDLIGWNPKFTDINTQIQHLFDWMIKRKGLIVERTS